MKQLIRHSALVFAAGLALPQAAMAVTSDAATAEPSTLSMVVSLVGLIVAVILLLEAMTLRKVALGGAITERISYVVLAIVCLAGSALAQWTTNFVADVTLEQVRLASQVLVIVAMGLLAAYFYSVRSALQGYLKAMTGSDRIPERPDGEPEEDERLA